MPTASLSQALRARMNYLTDRQGIIAGNIANANTPGYLPADLTFQPYLSTASKGLKLATTNGNHLSGGISQPANGKLVNSARFVEHNGNGVRLDEQMVKMNQTQLDYRMMTQIYSKQSNMQKIAIGKAQ